MKKIPLTLGKETLVDDEDFDELNKFKWFAKKNSNKLYAVRSSSRKDGPQHAIFLHRSIMGTPEGMHTDHIDGDGLNNQKSNLRICTHSENLMNKGKRKDNKSGYKGISPQGKKFVAAIQVKYKRIYLGLFDTKLLAYQAYCAASVKYHGEFANIT